MKRNRFYSLAYVVLWPVIHVLFRPVVTGKERIPDGNAVFCCNHTSNWDPLVIMICAGYFLPWQKRRLLPGRWRGRF